MGQDHISIRQASDKDRQRLANLIHFEPFVHRHLDWRTPLEWIGSQPYLIAERGRHLLAALACPPDPPSIAWIRLFAASAEMSVAMAWDLLWNEAHEQLEKQNGLHVAAISLQSWFSELLERSGFAHTHDVVMMMWEPGSSVPTPKSLSVTIRPMTLDDLPSVQRVDESAFSAEWRNSRDSLEMAFLQASVATVAEDESGLLGYQISTLSQLGGHLARLAVDVNAQGRGIGYALLCDMLHQFERRGVLRVTVNTQQDNFISQVLYKKAGFWETGEEYRVYQFIPS